MTAGSKEFYTSTYILASLDWSESNINITDNTSVVTVSLWYKRTNTYGGATTDYGNPFYVYIDGSESNIGSNFAIPGYDNSWYKVGEASKIITHNADGKKSISIGCYHDTSGSLFNCNNSWTVSLDTIPRATTPTASPQPLILSGATNTLTVALNRAASSFTHDVTCAIGSYTETKTGQGTSTTFSIPKTVLADFTATELTKTGTITCVTKNGATTIGTKTINFEASIDTTQEHPKIDSITLIDTNASTSAVESPGSFIKGASNLEAMIAVSVAGSYTKLKKVTVTCGGVSQDFTGVDGQSSGTVTFTYSVLDVASMTVTVEDQRGTTDTQTETWTLINYRPLTANGSLKRTTNTGSTIDFTLQGDCFGGDFGQQTNTLTISYKYREVGAQAWTDGGSSFTYTPTQGAADYSYTNTISGFLYNKQYDIVFTVTDLFSTADTAELRLLQGVPIQSWGPTYTDVYGELHLHDPDDPTDYINVRPLIEQNAADILTLFNRIKWDTSGIWFRVQIGRVLILLCTNQTGGQLQFGVTFDSVPFVLTGAPQGGYGHSAINQQIWDLTTSSMRWDAYYGSTTKYPASIMVIGLYSGQI